MALELLSPSNQVANFLRTEIELGRWKVEFPGTPALGKELGIDRKTIIAAIKQLEEEGLLKSQGPGKPRRVARKRRDTPTRMNIRLLVYEDDDRQRPHVMDLIPKIQELGHHIEIENKTLSGLGMNLERIKKHVEARPADAWILLAASQEVLEWFDDLDVPAMAMFGRRRKVPIASVGPDKVGALRSCVNRLVELGHRRIVLIAREERRHPSPGHLESEFLKSLESHGIMPGPYHLPEWKNEPASFHACLEGLLQHTPPTAFIFDEAQLYVAALQHFAQLKLSAPADLSMVSCDTHPCFEWCRPSVSHIQWDPAPIANQITHWVRQLTRGLNEKKPCYTAAEFIEGGSIGPAPNPR